jgi:hypothetical protein
MCAPTQHLNPNDMDNSNFKAGLQHFLYAKQTWSINDLSCTNENSLYTSTGTNGNMKN